MDVRGRYPSEVRIILRPWKASRELGREREISRGRIREKNHSSYIDNNLGYYGISFKGREKKLRLEVYNKGGRWDPIHVTEDWAALQHPHLVQCQGGRA